MALRGLTGKILCNITISKAGEILGVILFSFISVRDWSFFHDHLTLSWVSLYQSVI